MASKLVGIEILASLQKSSLLLICDIETEIPLPNFPSLDQDILIQLFGAPDDEDEEASNSGLVNKKIVQTNLEYILVQSPLTYLEEVMLITIKKSGQSQYHECFCQRLNRMCAYQRYFFENLLIDFKTVDSLKTPNRTNKRRTIQQKKERCPLRAVDF